MTLRPFSATSAPARAASPAATQSTTVPCRLSCVGASDMSTASIDCPPPGPDDPDPPPIAGQPGTALLTTGPTSFLLPFAGGVEQLRGEVADGGDGFFNTGTITVKPGPIVRVDG